MIKIGGFTCFINKEQIFAEGKTGDRDIVSALRRRFAFFDLEPAFASDGFKLYQAEIANKKFDALVDTVDLLNRAITDDTSLGSGFRIGHSYFCNGHQIDEAWLVNLVSRLCN